MRQQNVIIFSSGKNKCVAHAIAWGLDGGVCKAVVWDEFFNKIYGDEYMLTKSYALFPFLMKKIPSFDYAIIVAGDDDRMRKNDADGQEFVTARDNVIFELGLCSMALGDKRVNIVRHEDVRLIDDLRGYDGEEAQRLIRDGEIGRFRNTLAQFLVPGKNGACHVTASDAGAGFNRIFIDEIAFDEQIDNQTKPLLSAV